MKLMRRCRSSGPLRRDGLEVRKRGREAKRTCVCVRVCLWGGVGVTRLNGMKAGGGV